MTLEHVASEAASDRAESISEALTAREVDWSYLHESAEHLASQLGAIADHQHRPVG
jgi:hypothetical protein